MTFLAHKFEQTPTSKMAQVFAIVVTYNRLTKLVACIDAIRAQYHPPGNIIVVNNSSTDGTQNWLAQQKDITTITRKNSGGAAGFADGIEYAYNLNAELIWIMDDDCIPCKDALLELLSSLDAIKTLSPEKKPGWIASSVIWTDGHSHKMNQPQLKQPIEWLCDCKKTHSIPAVSASFTSLLLIRDAIEVVGLPMSAFVIWGDDIEYTARINSNGFSGYVSFDSICIHDTQQNISSGFASFRKENKYKLKYGIRNKIYLLRKEKKKLTPIKYIIKMLAKLFYKKLFWAIPLFLQSAVAGLYFNPTIKFPQPQKTQCYDKSKQHALP